MKKVLFNIGTLTGGGAERVVSIWSSILAKKGYNTSIYVAHRCDDEYSVSELVHIESTAKSVDEYMAMPKLARFMHKRKFIKKLRPDVMISFLPGTQIRTMLASFGVRCRREETVRVDPWDTKEKTSGASLWIHCYNVSDAILLQTEDQGDFFSKKNRKKCTVIRNPISKIYTDSVREGYSEKAKKFVAAGRLRDQKNYSLMIRAFAAAAKNCPGISLDIYGAGTDEYVKKLNGIISELGMTGIISLKGRTNDVLSAFLSADAFIMSSDHEGMPNSLMEAMATGLPCISTDCKTGPRDMIEDETSGFLCRVGDERDMEEKIRRIFSMSASEREEMGKAAKNRITELCDDEKNIAKLIEVIEG